MKIETRRLPVLLIAAVCFFSGEAIRSQTPVKDPVQTLNQIKEANKDLIDKQTKTIQALEDLQKAAEQLKVFGKRT